MPAQILGQTEIAVAATNTTVGAAVPAATQWAFTAILCNKTTFNVKVRLALAAAATPVAAEWILYDKEISPNETYDFTGLTLQAAKLVVVQADIANAISVTILGVSDPV